MIGLTIAHVLSDPARANGDNSNNVAPRKITVIARELPIDEHLTSQGWASPWAGANWSPLGEYEDERKVKWEKETV